MDATRARITEAALHLHTSVGPSKTSLVRIADAAGVTRATLYRHFESADALFGGCMEHWIGQHPPPDPEAWMRIGDFRERTRRALRDLYDWYAAHDPDLYPIYRDTAFTPESNQRQRRAIIKATASALLTAAPPGGVHNQLLGAAVEHFVSYPTWRSLASDSGLSPRQAAKLASMSVMSVFEAGSPHAVTRTT